MEEQKKKMKGDLTQMKRKMEMDDVPNKKIKGTRTRGKRKMEMDDVPIVYNKKWKMRVCTTPAESSPHQKLPHEVILDNILTRLPVKNLAKECSLVCKLWYKSIIHPHFVSLHNLLQSCGNSGYPSLIFDILNTPVGFKYLRQCTLRLDIDDDDNDDVYSFSKMTDFSIGKQELVGHCNGLQCLRSCGVRGQCFFHITNPSCRPKEFMAAMYPVPDNAFIFCCGFGYDVLVNEYKIVLVYSNSSTGIDVQDTFKCMVFTLGNQSWRESTTPNTLPVITTIGTEIIQGKKKKKRVIMSRMSFSRSAVYADGALYWRVLTREKFGGRIGDDEEDQEIEVLLCFDIHHEQFQLISLPHECELKIKTGTTTLTTEQEQQLIDHHLLVFEGSPCIARLQTAQQQQTDSNSCCKVHLYVLKDRLKSAWSIETFDVCSNANMVQDKSNPPPCIIATATSARTTTTTTITTATTIAAAAASTTSTTTTSTTSHAHQPITRILCATGRVILYWFDGVCVQFYDLRRKRLKMVKYTPADPTHGELFDREVARKLWPFDVHDVDTTSKLIYCRRDHIYYKLHSFVENSLPLKTFIPKGCTILGDLEKWYSESKQTEDGFGVVYTAGKYGMLQYHCFC